MKKIEQGPVKTVIRVTSEYGSSRMYQDFTVYQELDYVAVRTTVDWHEKWAMLKMAFQMNLNYLRASWEIPYGVAQREPDSEEYPFQTWLDLEGTNPGMETKMNGLSLLCDNRFAGSVSGKTAYLTVLRSPIYAHHEPYEPKEELEYVYVDQGVTTFTYGLYPHDGSWENAATARRGREFVQKPIALFETYHQGGLKQKGSFLEVNANNICIDVVKEAEDGSGDIILRACETAGQDTAAKIALSWIGLDYKAQFTPFEIKTIRIAADKEVREVSMLE